MPERSRIPQRSTLHLHLNYRRPGWPGPSVVCPSDANSLVASVGPGGRRERAARAREQQGDQEATQVTLAHSLHRRPPRRGRTPKQRPNGLLTFPFSRIARGHLRLSWFI